MSGGFVEDEEDTVEAWDGRLGGKGVDVAADAEGKVRVVFDAVAGCLAFVLVVLYLWVVGFVVVP